MVSGWGFSGEAAAAVTVLALLGGGGWCGVGTSGFGRACGGTESAADDTNCASISAGITISAARK